MEPVKFSQNLALEGLQLKKEYGEEFLNKSLYTACELGNIHNIGCYLERDVSPNVHIHDQRNRTAYHAAVMGRHFEAVKLLAERRANPTIGDLKKASPVQLALKAHPKILKLMLAAWPDVKKKDELYLKSLEEDKWDHASHLILYCSPFSAESLEATLEKKRYFLARTMLDKIHLTSDARAKLFLRTVKNGDPKAVSLLLESGFPADAGVKTDITFKGSTWDGYEHPFIEAVYLKNIQVSQLLLEKMTDVNSILLLDEDTQWTSLELAVKFGLEPIIIGLLDRGAQINTSSDGLCHPFLIAIENHFFSVADLLLEKGADLKWTNEEGKLLLDVLKDWMVEDKELEAYVKERKLLGEGSEGSDPESSD